MERAAAALSLLTAPRAHVIRSGHVKQIAASEVVPGDILKVDSGDLVAADARLIESASLRVNEAALTGESVPVEKRVGICSVETALADRSNMVFLGSSVLSGGGLSVVTATGMHTEIGQIASLLETTERGQTPL